MKAIIALSVIAFGAIVCIYLNLPLDATYGVGAGSGGISVYLIKDLLK